MRTYSFLLWCDLFQFFELVELFLHISISCRFELTVSWKSCSNRRRFSAPETPLTMLKLDKTPEMHPTKFRPHVGMSHICQHITQFTSHKTAVFAFITWYFSRTLMIASIIPHAWDSVRGTIWDIHRWIEQSIRTVSTLHDARRRYGVASSNTEIVVQEQWTASIERGRCTAYSTFTNTDFGDNFA